MAAPNVVTLRQGEAIANDVRSYPVPDVILLVDDTSPATITLSAPTQTELHAITLDAGTNTITLSAPAQSEAHAITLAAGSNTITLTAPSQGQLVELTLAAGSNTITLSAPTVPSLVLTMPVDTNTITLSAPTIPAVALTMPVTTNIVTLSAPATHVHTSLLPVNDDFTGPDDQPLETHNSSWTVTDGQLRILSNSVCSLLFTSGDNTALWNDNTFANDQYSKATVNAIEAGHYVGVCVRASLVGINLYGFNSDSIESTFYKKVGGGLTVFANGLQPVVAGDVIEIHAIGTSIYAYINNVLITSVVDASLSSGDAGVSNYGPTSVSAFTSWEGGDIIHVTLTATSNTITCSAPAQSQLVELTLAAGSNTITLSAPAQSEAHAITLAAGSNTVTLSAPAQSQVVELTLTATINLITLSAPDPALVVDQFIVATTNLIILSAPDPNFAFDQFLQAGNNTLANITAPDATLLVGVQYDGSGNITFTFAPAPVISLEAPNAELVQQGSLLAASNTVTVTAPAASLIAENFLAANTNAITVTAPVVILLVERTLVATANVIVLTAPTAVFDNGAVDLTVAAGANQITLTAPIAILTRRTVAAKRATARITLSKASSTVVAVQEPLTAKLGLVVSSSGVVVG